MRPLPALVLAIASVAAGCATAPDPAAVASSSAAGPASLPDFAIDGADLLDANATSRSFSWKGEVGVGVTPSLLFIGVGLVRPTVRLDVPAPAGTLFVLNVSLAWSSTADLDLFVRDADGALKCASAQGSLQGDDGTESCAARLWRPLDEEETWSVLVRADNNRDDGLPFEVTLRYDAVADAGLLGPAILPLAEGVTPPLAFAPPVLVSGDVHSAEPSIALDADDVVYYAAPVGPQTGLWRSTDGLTFEPVPMDGVPPFPLGGGDSDVAVDGTQDLYYADLTGLCNTVSSSHDGGASWLHQPLACDVPLVDRQWLATDGPDAVWLAFNGRIGATVLGSVDGGRTFPIRAYPPERGFCARGNIEFAKATGTLYLAGCDDEGPGVAVSTDRGVTWTWSRAAARSGEPAGGFCYTCNIFSVVDSDAAGNVYLVWSDPSDGTGLDVWFAASADAGASWSEPVKVNHVEGTHVLPWVAAGEDGRAVVVWYGTRYVGDPNEATGEWYAHAAATDDALAANVSFAEVLVSPEPVQHGPICTRGSGCPGQRNLLDFFEVALGRDGNPHVAFVDGRAGGSTRDSLLMYAVAGSRPATS